MSKWRAYPLYGKIIILLILGAIVGFILGPKAAYFKPLGDAYILLLKMLVVPLVFISIISGIAKLGSIKEFGQIGSRIMVLYLFTSTVAAAIGTLLATLTQPGLSAQGMLGDIEKFKYNQYSASKTILGWIPDNVFKSMTTMDMIPVILFAILFGVCLLKVGDQRKPLTDCIDVINSAMLEMTNFVTDFAPYGIFFLTMQLTGTLGSKMLAVAAMFIITQYIGLVIIACIEYPFLLKSLGQLSPIKFYRNIMPAMIMAASTTSSNATLPMSYRCSGERCGVPEKIYSFTLPLGATVNMDGFSLLMGVLAITALEVYNIPITPINVVQAVGMGLLLSVGAPGVKGSAVVMSAVLFQSLGLPMGLLPLVAAVNPIYDIGNTTVNVTGDHVCTCIVSNRLKLLNLEVFNTEKSKNA